MKKKLMLSKDKREELEKELKDLEEKKRPEISAVLEHARQNDLSEDTDDLSVMLEEKESVEDRILEIKDILANSEVITKNACNPSYIGIGTELTVQNSGKQQKLTIVASLESDPAKGYISDKSPLGKALMKGKEGAVVTFKVNGRSIEYKILKVC